MGVRCILPVAIATIAATPISASVRTANLTREESTEHRRLVCNPATDEEEEDDEALGKVPMQQLCRNDEGG